MEIEARVEKVEKRVERGEKRTKLIEQAILQMKDLVISHETRLDDFSQSIRESREDFNFKLNALIDLQLENEIGIRELTESTKALDHASRSQLTRIEQLENK